MTGRPGRKSSPTPVTQRAGLDASGCKGSASCGAARRGAIAFQIGRAISGSIVSKVCGSSPGPGIDCTCIPGGSSSRAGASAVATSSNASCASAAIAGRSSYPTCRASIRIDSGSSAVRSQRLARRALDIETDGVGEHRESIDQRDRQIAVVSCAQHQQARTPRIRERANHCGPDVAIARGPIPDRRHTRSIGLNDRALVHSPPSTSKLAIPRPGKFGSFSRIAISRRPDASTPSLSPSRLGSSWRRNVVITTSRTPSTPMAAS